MKKGVDFFQKVNAFFLKVNAKFSKVVPFLFSHQMTSLKIAIPLKEFLFIQKPTRSMKKNEFFFCFSLPYSHLWLRRKYFRSEKQEEKRVFLLLFARLFVLLHSYCE